MRGIHPLACTTMGLQIDAELRFGDDGDGTERVWAELAAEHGEDVVAAVRRDAVAIATSTAARAAGVLELLTKRPLMLLHEAVLVWTLAYWENTDFAASDGETERWEAQADQLRAARTQMTPGAPQAF